MELTQLQTQLTKLETERAHLPALLRQATETGDAQQLLALKSRATELPVLIEAAKVPLLKAEIAELEARVIENKRVTGETGAAAMKAEAKRDEAEAKMHAARGLVYDARAALQDTHDRLRAKRNALEAQKAANEKQSAAWLNPAPMAGGLQWHRPMSAPITDGGQ